MTWPIVLAIAIVVSQLAISGYVLWQRKRRGSTPSQRQLKFTRLGIATNVVAFVAMAVGISTRGNAILMATTALGAWIQEHGLFAYLALLYGATMLVQLALDRAGFRVWHRSSAV